MISSSYRFLFAKYEVFIESNQTKLKVQKKGSLLREVETPKYKKKEGKVKGEIWLTRAQHNLPLALPNKKNKN